MTYGHSPTESIVSIFKNQARDTGLKLEELEPIAQYFRDVRKEYTEFEGALKGIDSRILAAQVPGGMLTNMENQLKEQGASDKLNEVLDEIPKVREDLGYIPLVTPTSQIVGTQSVLNVLTGERYKSITKEASDILKGAYGKTPSPVNEMLQKDVLEDGEKPIFCRPADLIAPEIESLETKLDMLSKEMEFELCSKDRKIDDVLTYTLFPNVAIEFFKGRFGAKNVSPSDEVRLPESNSGSDTGTYTVQV